MKICFISLLFFCFVHPFSSSPIVVKSFNTRNDTIRKLEVPMKAMPQIDHFSSEVNHTFKRHAGKGEKESNSTLKSVESDKESLNNTIKDQQEDDLIKKKLDKKLADVPTNVSLKLESFLKTIVDEYFAKIHYIFKKAAENADVKLVPNPFDIKGHLAKADKNSNSNMTNKGLEDTIVDQWKGNLKKENTDGKSVDASNNSASNALAELDIVKAIILRISDYLLKKHHTLEKRAVKEDKKTISMTQLSEDKEHITKENVHSNIKNSKETMINVNSDQRMNHVKKENGIENPIENHPIQNSEQDIVVTVRNISASSNEKLSVEKTGMNSGKEIVLNNISNEQTSTQKSDNVFSQPEASLDGYKEIIPSHNSKIPRPQLRQENKSIFSNFNASVITQNESSSSGNISENELLQNRNLKKNETKRSISNSKNLKADPKINEDKDIIVTNPKPKSTNLKENNDIESKIPKSTKETSKNNQKKLNPKTESAIPSYGLVNKDQSSILKSEKSENENSVEIHGNVNGKISSMFSKKSQETPEKTKSHENDHVTTEKKVTNNFTSKGKLIASDAGKKAMKKDFSDHFVSIKNILPTSRNSINKNSLPLKSKEET